MGSFTSYYCETGMNVCTRGACFATFEMMMNISILKAILSMRYDVSFVLKEQAINNRMALLKSTPNADKVSQAALLRLPIYEVLIRCEGSRMYYSWSHSTCSLTASVHVT